MVVLWSPCHRVINVVVVAVVVYTVVRGPWEFCGGTAVILCWSGVRLSCAMVIMVLAPLWENDDHCNVTVDIVVLLWEYCGVAARVLRWR